jgi:hypothetical protein
MRKHEITTTIAQHEVDAFNATASIGDVVNVRLDNGETFTTKTRSEAQLLGGHTPVIWVDGISGAYLLDRVVLQ